MEYSQSLAPCSAWRFLFYKLIVAAMLASLTGVAAAGEDTKPVSIKCDGRVHKDLSSADKTDFGYELITRAMSGKKMNIEPMLALGEMDTLLTSSYGLRQPLATLTNKRALNQMALVSQLVMSGYVVSAKMLIGVVEREAVVPAETVRISRNMIYTLHEPTGDDDVLLKIEQKVKQADVGVSKVSVSRQSYARWVIRAYAYNDPIAVDAALSGYCSVPGVLGDHGVLTGLAKKVRFDPRTIKVIKE